MQSISDTHSAKFRSNLDCAIPTKRLFSIKLQKNCLIKCLSRRNSIIYKRKLSFKTQEEECAELHTVPIFFIP